MRALRAGPALAAALLLTVGLLAGCSEAAEDGGAAAGTVPLPKAQPAGFTVVDPAAVPEPSPDDCDALAGLAPPGERPPPGAMPQGTALARIAERGYFRAGVDQASYLASYRDPLSGEYQGFEIDVLREIARAIFGDDDPTRIRFTALTTSQRQRAIADGQVDIVVGTMIITCQRRFPERYLDAEQIEQFPAVELSTPYLMTEQRLLVSGRSDIASLEDLGESRICVSAGTAAEQIIAHSPLPSPSAIELVTVEGRADCLGLLQQGQVDAVTADEATLRGFLAQDPTVRIVGDSLAELAYGLAMDPGDPELARFVNHVLAEMVETGRWQEIIESWIGTQGVLGDAGLSGLQPPVPRYRDS